MMAVTTPLITFVEFEELPDPPGGYYELHHGELVTLTYPKFKHSAIQRKLQGLLMPFVPPGSFLTLELAFRPLPEHEGWRADVAWLSAERFREADRKNALFEHSFGDTRQGANMPRQRIAGVLGSRSETPPGQSYHQRRPNHQL